MKKSTTIFIIILSLVTIIFGIFGYNIGTYIFKNTYIKEEAIKKEMT